MRRWLIPLALAWLAGAPAAVVAAVPAASEAAVPAAAEEPLAIAAEAPTAKTQAPGNDFRRMYLFRFEFDNDTFLGDDNSFTAGWSFQLHSRLDDVWAPGYAKWIGKVPGLGDDGPGGRVTRWAWGIGQAILTPDDISIEEPQPNDAPWAGMLGISVSWSAYDNKKMAALQVYAGCMGPCSGAESVQKFIHEDLGFGEPPQGWDNQLVNQALGNVNYEYRYKVYAPAAARYFTPRRFAQDLSVGSQAAVGNLETMIKAQVEYRFGWGLPMGFTKVPDPPGWGIMLDPVYVEPLGPLPSEAARWRGYFTVMLRHGWFTYQAPAEGGETVNGGNHPPLRPYPGGDEVIAGFHLARVPFAVHVTYYRYLRQDGVGIEGSSDWVNLSFEYRF